MKKLFGLVLGALLLLAAPAQAQVKFGLKAGLNVSKVKLDKEVFDSKNRTGFFVGPMVEFSIPLVGLNLDAALLYDNKVVGVKGEAGDDIEVDKDETLQYLDIPINLKYVIGLGSMASVYVATGPQFSYNIGDKKLFDNSYSLKSSQFSWNFGAGVKLVQHLQVGYNFNLGMGNTADVKSGTVAGEVGNLFVGKKLKGTNTHQLSVAYLF